MLISNISLISMEWDNHIKSFNTLFQPMLNHFRKFQNVKFNTFEDCKFGAFFLDSRSNNYHFSLRLVVRISLQKMSLDDFQFVLNFRRMLRDVLRKCPQIIYEMQITHLSSFWQNDREKLLLVRKCSLLLKYIHKRDSKVIMKKLHGLTFSKIILFFNIIWPCYS